MLCLHPSLRAQRWAFFRTESILGCLNGKEQKHTPPLGAFHTFPPLSTQAAHVQAPAGLRPVSSPLLQEPFGTHVRVCQDEVPPLLPASAFQQDQRHRLPTGSFLSAPAPGGCCPTTGAPLCDQHPSSPQRGTAQPRGLVAASLFPPSAPESMTRMWGPCGLVAGQLARVRAAAGAGAVHPPRQVGAPPACHPTCRPAGTSTATLS